MKDFMIKKCTAYLPVLFLMSCGGDFLEVKYNQNSAIPASIKDYQAMLDVSDLMNNNSSHSLGLIGGDEFYVPDRIWNAALYPYEANAYIWADDVYGTESVADWDYAYKAILQCNIVLDGIDKVVFTESERSSWNNVKGSALFLRAYALYQIAQEFCLPYNAGSASSDLGIPLRLEADITMHSERASVAETYDQILKDIKAAAEILPAESQIKQRPSRPAAFGLLSRVYLQMGNYHQALYYAEQCLSERNELVDFKTLDLDMATGNTFDEMIETNPEILFMANARGIAIAAPYSNFMADTVLRAAYAIDDLREKAYFMDYLDMQIFCGSYRGDGSWFTGIAVDEVLLIRAECQARMNKPAEALADLNQLLIHRFDAGFEPLQSNNGGEILKWIIEERRKELVLRGLRWSDLRRLNQEEQFAKTLIKIVNGQQFELSPNSPRYVWPLPHDVILQSGMEQNPR